MSSERGMSGMRYEEKSFSVGMGSSGPIVLSADEQVEADKLKAERLSEKERVRKETQAHLKRVSTQKVTKKLIPYGTRILVKKRTVGDSYASEHILLPDETKGLPTDIADVVEVPEQSFTDKTLLLNADKIIIALSESALKGDASAVDSLIKFREYLQVMTIQKGDVLLMARYGGTDFFIPETKQSLCVADPNGIYCLIKEKVVNPVVQPANGIAETKE